jgi:hypothetical protein
MDEFLRLIFKKKKFPLLSHFDAKDLVQGFHPWIFAKNQTDLEVFSLQATIMRLYLHQSL